MKIPGLSEEDQKRLDECVPKLISTIDKYFPEIRNSWDQFESRVYMTVYLELIHAGFFKNEH